MHLLNLAVLLAAAATTAASSSCEQPVLRVRPPPKAHCSVYGTLSKPQVLSQYPRSDVDSCSGACFNVAHCMTFSVNGKTGVCTLYSATLKAMGYTAIGQPTNKHPLSFWSKRCFVCPPPSSTTTTDVTTTSSTSSTSSTTSSSSSSPSATPCVPSSGNLVQNGDFEASTTSYAPWTYDTLGDSSQPAPQIVSPGEDGTGNAFRVAVVYDTTPPGDSNTYLEQTLTTGVCASSSYTFSFDYMLNNTTPYSGIRAFVCGQQVLIVNADEPANTWLSSSTLINTCQDNYADITMYLQVGQDTAEETFLLDNISFELAS